MNVIQIRDAIDSLIDRTKSARFTDAVYMAHINNAITDDLRDRSENIKQSRKYDFQSTEQVMRDLYTLVVDNVTIPAVGNTIPYPANYRFFGRLLVTVDGVTKYPLPCEYSQEGPLLLDAFRKPSKTKFYYIETDSAFRILHGGTALQSGSFSYLKYPAIVSIGQESDKVNSTGTLQTNTQYIVYADAVYNGASYPSGATFVTTLVTTLTSGIVIPTSVVVNCDMPVNIHQDLVKRAAETMELSISELQKSQLLQQQSEQD